MELTIHLPEDIGHRLLLLPDRDDFVAAAVARALNERPARQPPKSPRAATRWQRLVDRVSRDPEQLGDYYPEFNAQMRQFRESFRFKHDGAT